MADFAEGDIKALAGRKITEATCTKFKYAVGNLDGQPVQIANYYTPDGSELVAQKIRGPDKSFRVIGDLKRAGLFGQQLWRDSGRMVVVTEGEIDALTVSQLQDNKYPVVSVPNGAQGAKRAITAQLEWLLKFDTVVLMFDDDSAGAAAAKECAPLFPTGRCKIAKIAGYKDANEALKAGAGDKVIEAMWGAKDYRPDGILTFADIAEAMRTPQGVGIPWWDERLTKLTYGRRLGECYALGGGTGCGKTDWFMQQSAHDMALGMKVGMFYLEQSPTRTGLLLAGKLAGKRFHVPDGGWTQAELSSATDELLKSNKAFIYNSAGASFGATAWDTIRDTIRFLAHHEGVQSFYLDHLTALAAAEDDERLALEKIMAELAGLTQELNILLHFVSHLATPDGTPHEEGGRVMIRHFKGSRSIGFWSHFMFGLERDTQSDDPALRGTTTFRVLKDRFTGDSTGQVVHLGYLKDQGRLQPQSAPAEHGFADETNKDF
jgi:twinkle protein